MATGSRAAALRPITPSASQSVAKALMKAMTIHPIVLMFNGMHNTMAGRMVIIANGVNWK